MCSLINTLNRQHDNKIHIKDQQDEIKFQKRHFSAKANVVFLRYNNIR